MPNQLLDGPVAEQEGPGHGSLECRLEQTTTALVDLVQRSLRRCRKQMGSLTGCLLDTSRSVETGDDRCLLLVGTPAGLTQIEFTALRLTGALGVRVCPPGGLRGKFGPVAPDAASIEAHVEAFAVQVVRSLRTPA